MNLMNNETKLDVVFSDMYVGLKLLGRVQAEQRLHAIKLLSDKNKMLQSRCSKDLCGEYYRMCNISLFMRYLKKTL
jgi:hypothetical protein